MSEGTSYYLSIRNKAEQLWALIEDGECYDSRCAIIRILQEKTAELFREQKAECEQLRSLKIVKDGFYRMYDKLAEQGKTDGAGGMEYRRVRQAWEDAGRPKGMRKFILETV